MQKVPLVQIQDWLGYSTISTTTDIYLHLLFDSKLDTAETIKSMFSDEKNPTHDRFENKKVKKMQMTGTPLAGLSMTSA